MPPPEDAPAATGTITAGGGGSDDGDEDDNDNPQIPKDAPATSDALTAKKIECLPGQEVPLFSTTCELQPQANTWCDQTAERTSLDPSPEPSTSSSSQEEGSEAESGGVEQEFDIASDGNNALQCVPPLQFGNLQNPNAFPREPDETFDDGIEFAPDECIETIQQSAACQ